MLDKVLVAYDDSPGARRALELGTEIVRRLSGGELVLVSVEEHLPHFPATVGEYQVESAFEERRCQRWLLFAKAYAAEQYVDVRTELRTGHPAQELLHAAERWEADLLILSPAREN